MNKIEVPGLPAEGVLVGPSGQAVEGVGVVQQHLAELLAELLLGRVLQLDALDLGLGEPQRPVRNGNEDRIAFDGDGAGEGSPVGQDEPIGQAGRGQHRQEAS